MCPSAATCIGLVEGVELNVDNETPLCESREWAKGQRETATKVHEGEKST